jgi:hypothetical protein
MFQDGLQAGSGRPMQIVATTKLKPKKLKERKSLWQ